jgi:hypothetical protein
MNNTATNTKILQNSLLDGKFASYRSFIKKFKKIEKLFDILLRLIKINGL